MNICSDHHDEVCYEGRCCPACELAERIDSLNDRISQLNEELAELKQREK